MMMVHEQLFKKQLPPQQGSCTALFRQPTILCHCLANGFEKSPRSFGKVGDQVYDCLFEYAGLGPEMKDQDYSSPAAHAAIGSIRDGSAFRDSMYADGIDRYFR